MYWLLGPSRLFPRSTDNTTPKTLEFDEDTHDSEAPVVADDTHDPETPVVLETPVVDDDFIHVDKKQCLNIVDKKPFLDKDRDKKPGLEE